MDSGEQPFITKSEFEKYVSIIGVDEDYSIETIVGYICAERQGKAIEPMVNGGPAHYDIWKNLMYTAGLIIDSDDICFDFNNPTIRTIIDFFDRVEAKEVEFGVFKDSFIDYISVTVNVRNIENTLLNDALIHYQGILKNKLQISDLKSDTEDGETMTEDNIVYSGNPGENVILYGVPGCGKSHTIKTEYCDDARYMQRVVFHPDYTYSDFIGQILPVISNDGATERISYKVGFTPAT